MELVSRHPFGPSLTVEKHKLDNGLTLLLLADRSAPVVAYQTWYRVGSRHEKEGLTGIAHLFEHLMFNQTETMAAGEFDRTMEAAGAETNAGTWVDWTYYRDSLPAAKLEMVARLEADRMQHLTVTDKQVESEREVVANERRQRVDDDIEGFLSEELFKLSYTAHPYHHPTIGWMRDIMAISTDDARAFYKTYYAPNNATLVLVGDFDPSAAQKLVQDLYGNIPASTIPLLGRPDEPVQREQRRGRFPKAVTAERALFAWRAPEQGHKDWLILSALVDLLVGSASSRLYRELVIEREVASSAHGMLMPFYNPGILELSVTMKRELSSEVAEQAIDAAVARLQDELVSAAELAKIKNRLETDFWADLDTVDGKAEALGHYETTLGDYRQMFQVAGRVEAITAEDLRQVARTYLGAEKRTIVVAEPSGEDEGAEDGE